MDNLSKKTQSNPQQKFNAMNDALMNVAKIYMQWHDRKQSFDIDEKLCRAEIHTIQAIGNNEGINITQLAKLFAVTKPTMSEKVKKLSKLKLIEKQKNPENNKEIHLVLTAKGKAAYESHEKKHAKMFCFFKNHFGKEHTDFLNSFIDKIQDFSVFLNTLKKEEDF